MSEMIDTITVRWEYEDRLGLDLTKGMFLASRVIDGVRMYPYVLLEGDKYFLECETKKPLVFRSEVLGVPYQHDENACRAWFAYLDLPWKANVEEWKENFENLKEVAEQFGTTVDEMKEHIHCRRDRYDEKTL